MLPMQALELEHQELRKQINQQLPPGFRDEKSLDFSFFM